MPKQPPKHRQRLRRKETLRYLHEECFIIAFTDRKLLFRPAAGLEVPLMRENWFLVLVIMN